MILSRFVRKPPGPAEIDWSHPLANGLLGCYLFTTASATVRNLARPGYRDAVAVGTQRRDALPLGYSPYFGGSSAFDLGGNFGEGATTGSAFSWVGLWRRDGGASNQQIIGRFSGTQLFQIGFNTNVFRVAYGVSPFDAITGSTISASLGEVSFAFTYDNGTGTLYDGGVQRGQDTSVTGSFAASTAYRLGMRGGDNAEGARGWLQYAYFYGRALTATEVAWISREPFAFLAPYRSPATFYAISSGTTASLSATLGAVTLSGSATVVAPVASNANLTQALDAITLSGAATAAAAGASNATLSQSIASVTLSGAATSAAPGSSTGALSQTIGAVGLSGAATAGAAGTVTGTLNATLAAVTLSGAATSAAPGNTTASMSQTIGGMTLSSVVTVTTAGTVATMSATLDAITLSGAATHTAPSGSTASLSQTVGGVSLAGIVSTVLFVGPTAFASTATLRGVGVVTATGTLRGVGVDRSEGSPR